MEVIKGKVQQINVKEPRDGQYGKWANYGIKINDAWYNGALNEDKQTGALTLKDKNFNEVKVDMEVEFLLEEKNGYKNITSKSMFILSSGGTGTPQPTQQPTETKKVPSAVSDDPSEDELISKFCDGLAALVAAFKFKGKEKPSSDQIARLAGYIKKMF